ncbi:hypothetical protein COL940_009588 [Colletotrichum noveboracense]|nr:hypothetical protein COL940_009588 [Colletotrichum noveboracense]KAJ0279032.1 hypothetical protein CBS470a_009477 [Colletotrichum nupharicola]
MDSKPCSSAAPERKEGRRIMNGQESASDTISKIRRGIHTVWGGIGAKEERQLRDVLQRLVDDLDGLEKNLSGTAKRLREDDKSAIDTKRYKTDPSSEEPTLRSMNLVSPPHIPASDHCKIEKIEDDDQLHRTTSLNPVIDLTSDTTSDEESHAGKNLENILKRFQGHAKKIEPKPDYDDLLLDNAEYIDRFRPSQKHHVYDTGVERLPTSTSELFLPDRQATLRSSSGRSRLSPRIVAGTPIKTEQSKYISHLNNASTVSQGHQAIYTPGSSRQKETMGTSRIFSKKVHWPTGKETVADTGKDLSRERREARRQRRGA